jgi:DNA phosphorothioation-associated putative methyltransferase
MNAHRTAISRKKASKPLLMLLDTMSVVEEPILDYGCGKGQDVIELQDRGFKAFGYDPYYAPRMPRGKFKTVLMTYVVNVIQTPQERNEAIRDAWKRVRKGGRLIITARTPTELRAHAERSGWKPCREAGGGYITGTLTFQRGYSTQQLDIMVRRLHLEGLYNTQLINPSHAGGAMLIMTKE